MSWHFRGVLSLDEAVERVNPTKARFSFYPLHCVYKLVKKLVPPNGSVTVSVGKPARVGQLLPETVLVTSPKGTVEVELKLFRTYVEQVIGPPKKQLHPNLFAETAVRERHHEPVKICAHVLCAHPRAPHKYALGTTFLFSHSHK